MKGKFVTTATIAALAAAVSLPVFAQEQSPAEKEAADAALKDGLMPPGVVLAPSPQGPEYPGGHVYATTAGRSLYAMNLRFVGSRTGERLKYCSGPCQAIWRPFVPPAGATPIGHWTIITAAEGPQWAYRGNPVFTYVEDKARGDARGQGYQNFWRLIAHMPPRPRLEAPKPVDLTFYRGNFLMTDGNRNLLYVDARPCRNACDERVPLAAGMTSGATGQWTVVTRDDRLQWAYRGKPVFVSRVATPADLAEGQATLTP